MKTNSKMYFREFYHRQEGSFYTKDGEKVEYCEAYILKCDYVSDEDKTISEFEFTIQTTETNEIEKLKKHKYGDEIVLELKIVISRKR